MLDGKINFYQPGGKGKKFTPPNMEEINSPKKQP